MTVDDWSVAESESPDGSLPGGQSTDRKSAVPSPDRSPSRRYRYLIPLVDRLDTPVTVDRVVDAMYLWERELVEDDEKSWYDIHEELFLVDLPVLDRAGLLEFDTERGLVSRPDR